MLRLLHSIPNGGGRGKEFITRSGKKFPPLLAVKLKAEGLLAGFPDLELNSARGGFIGLQIEMKTECGTLSDSQKRIIPLLEAEGNMVVVCYNATQAIDAIQNYVQLLPTAVSGA